MQHCKSSYPCSLVRLLRKVCQRKLKKRYDTQLLVSATTTTTKIIIKIRQMFRLRCNAPILGKKKIESETIYKWMAFEYLKKMTVYFFVFFGIYVKVLYVFQLNVFFSSFPYHWRVDFFSFVDSFVRFSRKPGLIDCMNQIEKLFNTIRFHIWIHIFCER